MKARWWGGLAAVAVVLAGGLDCIPRGGLDNDGAADEAPGGDAGQEAADGAEADHPSPVDTAPLDAPVDVSPIDEGGVITQDATADGDTGGGCVPAANGTRFVDHAVGTDDASHGGGPGTCAYRTLTYALGRAPDEISLAPDTYKGTVAGEELPFLLTGQQTLTCNGALLENDPDQGTYLGIVQFAGSRNSVTGCNFDGNHWGGYCLLINASSADPAHPHSVTQSTFTGCDNVTVKVPSGFNNIAISSNSFTLNFAVIYFEGDHANARVVNNTFIGNVTDVLCDQPSPTVTGSGNVRGGGAITCTGCAACPF